MSTPRSAREVATQWFQRIWGERDESAIAELMSTESVGYHEGGVISRGPEDFRKFYRDFIHTFPDMHLEVLDIVAEGDKAFVRWEARGTHQGEAFGIAATKRLHEFSGITWMIVRDGMIIGGGDSWNLHGLISRMAAAPLAET
jgi:ketosteroid isomerase-like protein